jgi:hypothetical protein
VTIIAVICGGCGVTNKPSADESNARRLGPLKDRLDSIDREVVLIQPGRPLTMTSLQEYATRLSVVLPKYHPLRADVLEENGRAQQASDQDVRRASSLLLDMVTIRDRGLSKFVRAIKTRSVTQETTTAVQVANQQVNELNAEWTRVANRLNARYR